MAELVSKTYSEALFEVGVEEGKVDLFKEELDFIVQMFDENPEFYELFKTPKVNAEERKAVMTEVFGGKISDEMLNFLKILLDKQRSSAIYGIQGAFTDKVDLFKGNEVVTVESAIELNAAELESLKAKLDKLTGKNTVLTNVVNEEILGGVIVKMGDKVIDGSVKSKLDELKVSLAQIIM